MFPSLLYRSKYNSFWCAALICQQVMILKIQTKDYEGLNAYSIPLKYQPGPPFKAQLSPKLMSQLPPHFSS